MSDGNQIALFNAFWRAAGSNVDPASVHEPDRNSGLPDIVCRLDGQEVGFELTAATNEDLHEIVATGGAIALWMGSDEIDGVRTDPHETAVAIRRKANKRYRGSMPVELLIHELLAKVDAADVWLDEFESEARALIDGSVFRRVWVTSHSGDSVYAVFPRAIGKNSPLP